MRPIEELIPGSNESDPYLHVKLDEEINKLIPVVMFTLDAMGIGTVIEYDDREFRSIPDEPLVQMVRRRIDVIHDYFNVPRSAEFFDGTIHTLDRGIGALETAVQRSRVQLFSPITWLAWIVQIPILVLERAGAPMEDANAKGIAVVAWALRLGMLTLVTLAATKLGISIPWDRIATLFK